MMVPSGRAWSAGTFAEWPTSVKLGSRLELASEKMLMRPSWPPVTT
jgi:hypothetical protein